MEDSKGVTCEYQDNLSSFIGMIGRLWNYLDGVFPNKIAITAHMLVLKRPRALWLGRIVVDELLPESQISKVVSKTKSVHILRVKM